MKKILLLLLVFVLAFSLIACGDDEVVEGPQGEQGIQGEKGDKGDTGAKGDKGDKGDAGKDGVTPTIEISDDGYWVINGVKTDVKASGEGSSQGGNPGAENPQGLDFYPKDDGTYIVSVGNAKYLSNIVIPARYLGCAVSEIAEDGFMRCERLKSITIPNTVTVIGEYAFEDCEELVGVAIPDSVTSIGTSAFSGCTGLTSVTLGNNVTSIGDDAFSYCTKLTSVTIGNNVTSIGSSAFGYCTGLTEINFNATAMNDLLDGGYYSVSNVFSNAGSAGAGITLNIGANVTKIPNYLFYAYDDYDEVYSAKITTVNFASGSVCESIGDSAFSNCDSLMSVTIPDSVTLISYFAFGSCSSLTSVTIGNGVTSIGDSAFSYCTSLTSVTIGNGVTSIGDWAFSYCTGLTTINYLGSEAEWNAISKGSNWNYNTGSYTINYNYDGE